MVMMIVETVFVSRGVTARESELARQYGSVMFIIAITYVKSAFN